MPVRPIPEGYTAVTPYLIIRGAARAIDWYKQVFGATEKERMHGPDGRVGHAEIRVGGAAVMLADESPERNALGPQSLGGTSVHLLLYVEDVDRRFEQAVAAGAKVIYPIKDQFYGDRSGTILDPFGHSWTIATHTEDVPPEEMMRRAQAAQPPA